MKTTVVLVTGALALIASACSPSPAASESAPPAAPTGATKPADSMANMPMPTPEASQQAAATIASAGKVAAVDAKAGSVKIDHEAIAALNWPAMSMTFTVTDPAILNGVAVGDSVMFEIKSASESSVLKKLEKK